MAENLSRFPYVSPGRQSASPCGHYDPAASRITSPLSRPFSDSSPSGRFVASPDRSLAGSTFGMEAASYGAERIAVFDRGPISYLRVQGNAAFSTEHDNVPMQISANHLSKEDRTYFGLTSRSPADGNFYRGPLERSYFDKVQFNIHSHDGDKHHPYRYAESDYLMSCVTDRNHLFSSHHGRSQASSVQPYTENPVGYTHHSAHTNGSHLDSAERIRNHFSSSVPSFISLGSEPNYAFRNSSALTSFGPYNTPLTTGVYNSFSSSLEHSANYCQLSVPPPAHTRFQDVPVLRPNTSVRDVPVLRPNLSVRENRQSLEDISYKPQLSVLTDSLENVMQGWNLASTTQTQRLNDDACFDRRPQLLTRKKDQDETWKDNMSVRSRETTECLLNEPSFRASDITCMESSFSPVAFNNMYTQTTDCITSVSSREDLSNKESLTPVTARAMSSSPNHIHQKTAKVVKGVQITAELRTDLESQDGTSDSSITASPLLSEIITVTSPTARKCVLPVTNSNSSPLVVTSDMYLDFNDDGKLQGKDVQNCADRNSDGHKSKGIIENVYDSKQYGREDLGNHLSSKPESTEAGKTEANTRNSGISNLAVKEEPQLYDSSTSEYEPPSPHVVPVQSPKPISERKLSLRKKSWTMSFAEDSDSADGERPPRITLIIKQGKLQETPIRRRRPKQARSVKRRKKGRGKLQDKLFNRTCPVCQKTFSRADSLTCHMRVHTGDRPFHCQQCDATYKVSSHLRDHVRSKHSNSRPFACAKCSKTFTYSTARRRHEKICGKDLSERVEFHCANCEKGFVTAKGFIKHQSSCGVVQANEGFAKNRDFPFSCSVCGKSFSNFPGLDRHQRFFCGKTPQKGRYFCAECGKMFQKRNRYITHTRRHTGEKPYKCQQCDTSFYDANTLRRHVDRHEGNRKFKCSLCDAAFYMKRCLSLHVMRIHCGMRPYKCNECDSDFSSGYKLSRHIRRVHRQERRFKCMLCSKGFFESSNWMKHMRQHALQPDKPVRGRMVKQHICRFCNRSFFMKDLRAHITSEHPGVTVNEAITKELARCDLCSKDFSCQESLRVHRLRHSGMKPFQCDKCDMAFVLKSALVLHQRKHSDYRPHCCSECGKTFRWRASVSQHMITYHTPKPDNAGEDVKKFTCHECGKRFKRQICLKVHLKRHGEVMPCICSDCGKGFVDLCRLKIHMSMHDGPKPFMCEICGAGFFYQYLLDDHIKRRHTFLPRQAWLCEECGKSLCRKDSLQKHMALHAKYRDGKIPKAGRRKGTKYPAKHPKPPTSGDVTKGKRGRPIEWRKNPALMSWRAKFEVTSSPSNKASHDNFMEAATEEIQSSFGVFEEPYQLNLSVHHPLP